MFAYALGTAKRAWSLFRALAIIIVPVLLAVRLLEQVGAVAWLGQAVAPLMAPVGLSPELGIAFVACVLIGPPAGLAALAGMGGEVTLAEVTILGSMMLFAHALPIECAIVRRAGGSFWGSFALRLGAAFAYAALLNAVFAATGWLAAPADLSALSPPDGGGWWAWLLGALQLLLTVFAILLALLVLLDAMERSGLTGWLTRALHPLLRASGLTERTAPLVTVGLLLGLTYGAGVIIREIEERGIEPRDASLCLAWVALCHSVIEDTGLILLTGANLWAILVGRVVFTLIVVRAMAWGWTAAKG